MKIELLILLAAGVYVASRLTEDAAPHPAQPDERCLPWVPGDPGLPTTPASRALPGQWVWSSSQGGWICPGIIEGEF